MPSGISINWAIYDAIIINELPTTTISCLAKKLGIHPKPLGVRAKKLGIKPAKKVISDDHKKQISKSISKSLTEDQRQYIINNYKKCTRRQLADELKVSCYIIKKEMDLMGLMTPCDIINNAIISGSITGSKLGGECLRERLQNDTDFAEKWKNDVRNRSKHLWEDDVYRLKIRNSIRNAYINSDLRERLSLISKERYLNDPEVRAILSAPRPFKTSKLNDDVASVLDGHGITYEREYEINNYKFDFKINNILLEVNGEYWHKLPNNMRNDQAKATIIQLYHPEFQLRTIWEREFRSVRGKERLLEILGLSNRQPTIIELNDIKLDKADKSEANTFLSSFHYLGRTNRCKYAYGAYLYGELIAVAVFGSLVRQNITKSKAIELVRLCRHPHFYNRNLMSKFLSWSCKEIKKLKIYNTIVSYADTTIHEGTIYKACNWIDEGLCQPDYQYISDAGVPMHKKTLYNRAKAAKLTERMYAEVNGYSKIYAGRKRRFVINIT